MAAFRAVFVGFVVALLGARGAASSGQAFLGRDPLHHAAKITDLLNELERISGPAQRQATERRVDRLEASLQPMFAAMPKDVYGNLHATSVRYLLHRLFVQRHGWFVNGLDTAGESWNSSSPARVFKEHAGSEIHDLFEGNMNSSGFSLHDVAVFAATLETLVHTENVDRLRAAYRVLQLSEFEEHGDEEAIEAMKAYMTMYVLDISHAVVSSEEYAAASSRILELYPTWPDTVAFVLQVRQSVLAGVVGKERTSWDSTLRVLEEVGERYGRWQDTECRGLKDQLVKLDVAGNGRVPLDRFYEQALTNETWMFVESVPYLRHLGALDESDPQRVSVLIANYINAPANCLASSKFYSVCCINECEELLGLLEMHIGAPEASPALVAQLVSGMTSRSVAVPRKLDDSLLRRLDEIAAHNGGSVPLHARLFSQWMHHAYPRECAYPHVSGTTNPQRPEAFYATTGNEVEVTHEEILDLIDQAARHAQNSDIAEQPLPWSTEEELFVHQPPVANANHVRPFVRGLALLLGSSSMALLGMHMFTKDLALLIDPSGQHKYVV